MLMLEKAREKFRKENYICFTSDLDWAPEPAIEKTLRLFMGHDIRPTMFVTHPSKVIEKYNDKIDLGIHPNFIQPSSQGESMDEIIDYCRALAPETRVFRAHRWFSSNDIYDRLVEKNFTYESNVCTNLDLAEPFLQRSGMISFPVYFEDGAYIVNSKKIDFDSIKYKFEVKGLKIINIHPMHYALNTPYFQYTRQIKDGLTREEWNEMDENMLEDLEFKGHGIRNFILELVEFAERSNVKIITLKDAYKICMQELE